jgi:hypothetical protein
MLRIKYTRPGKNFIFSFPPLMEICKRRKMSEDESLAVLVRALLEPYSYLILPYTKVHIYLIVRFVKCLSWFG